LFNKEDKKRVPVQRDKQQTVTVGTGRFLSRTNKEQRQWPSVVAIVKCKTPKNNETSVIPANCTCVKEKIADHEPLRKKGPVTKSVAHGNNVA